MKISTLLKLTSGWIAIVVTDSFGLATYLSAQNYKILAKLVSRWKHVANGLPR